MILAHERKGPGFESRSEIFWTDSQIQNGGPGTMSLHDLNTTLKKQNGGPGTIPHQDGDPGQCPIYTTNQAFKIHRQFFGIRYIFRKLWD